jgi:hypothetical protein
LINALREYKQVKGVAEVSSTSDFREFVNYNLLLLTIVEGGSL